MQAQQEKPVQVEHWTRRPETMFWLGFASLIVAIVFGILGLLF